MAAKKKSTKITFDPDDYADFDVRSELIRLSAITEGEAYYTRNGLSAHKVIDTWDLDFNLGNVVKYICRAGSKPGNTAVDDLKKAKDYLDYEIGKLSERTSDDGKSDERTDLP